MPELLELPAIIEKSDVSSLKGLRNKVNGFTIFIPGDSTAYVAGLLEFRRHSFRRISLEDKRYHGSYFFAIADEGDEACEEFDSLPGIESPNLPGVAVFSHDSGHAEEERA